MNPLVKLERLDKILSNSGFGTRTEVKRLVKQGVVKVGENVVKDSAHKVNPDADKIFIQDKQLVFKRFVYFVMNKPVGVISATWDSKHQTVIDLLDEADRRYEPFPVGRLDIDTTGLLLLTNNGDLAHNLLSPKKHVDKRYFAVLRESVGQKEVEAFREGIELKDGYLCKPADLFVGDPDNNIELVIHEGKFHQVKRMFEAEGNEVLQLERLEMGPLSLDKSLMPGEYREVNDEEMKSLLQYL